MCFTVHQVWIPVIPAIDKLIKHQHNMSGIFCTNETMRAFLFKKVWTRVDFSTYLLVIHRPIILSPIGLNGFCQNQTWSSLDLPIIASFQKDGNGWVEGNTPKLVKGQTCYWMLCERFIRNMNSLFFYLALLEASF